jgi:hypothetical protein
LQEFDWFDKGADGPLKADLTASNGLAYLTFKTSDGTDRRLMICRSSSLDELRGKFKISRAQIFWKWEKVEIFDLSTQRYESTPASR